MKSSWMCTGALLVALSGSALAQIGPDVIVGDLPGISNYGSVGGISAFAVGTTSCNVGDTPLQWVAGTNQHPVIGQNMYRLKNGRFEQIGMSWLKHGFTALAQSLCDSCNNPGTGSLLGVGCSDPYGSGLNGTQSGLGPRWEVNAATGAFNYPFASPPTVATIGRRLQVSNTDLDPALNSGASYYVEGHYVTPDDAAAGNKNNNASWRPITITQTSGTSYNAAVSGSTHRQESALWAWRAADANVAVQNMDIAGDGRFIIAHSVTSIGGGLFHWEFAVHNLSSDRSGQAFTVNLPVGTVVSNVGFHDVDYHPGDGDPYSLTDWTSTVGASSVSWATQTYAANVNANALRWGTVYNFRFDANTDVRGDVVMTLFKPGSPTSETLSLCTPSPAIPPFSGTYTLNQSYPYDFVNIAGIGLPGPTSDDSGITVPIGFIFPFYGVALQDITISSNGFLTLPGGDPTVFTNPTMPNANSPNGVIAGYWDDLNPSQGGTITYATVGTSPNRRFIVDYNAVRRHNTTQNESFQIALDECGNITTTIVASANGGLSATRGIEDPSGAIGIQASRNTAGTATAGTTWAYIRTAIIPNSAGLQVLGTGLPNTNFGFRILSEPFKGLIMLADFTGGPTTFGCLGSMNLGFTPFMIPVADFPGVFTGAPNLSAVTDSCGEWEFLVNTGPSGIPSGFTLYCQGLVLSANAPNGLCHFTTPIVYTQP